MRRQHGDFTADVNASEFGGWALGPARLHRMSQSFSGMVTLPSSQELVQMSSASASNGGFDNVNLIAHPRCDSFPVGLFTGTEASSDLTAFSVTVPPATSGPKDTERAAAPNKSNSTSNPPGRLNSPGR